VADERKKAEDRSLTCITNTCTSQYENFYVRH